MQSACCATRFDGFLPVRRGIADIRSLGGSSIHGNRCCRAAITSAVSSTLSVVCDSSTSLVLSGEVKPIDVGGMFDQVHMLRRFPPPRRRPRRKPLCADVDDLIALRAQTAIPHGALCPPAGTSRPQCSSPARRPHHAAPRGDTPMRGEHDRNAGFGGGGIRNLIEFLDEHGATPGELFDDMLVVHDLPAHIHRRQTITRSPAVRRIVSRPFGWRGPRRRRIRVDSPTQCVFVMMSFRSSPPNVDHGAHHAPAAPCDVLRTDPSTYAHRM